jgi:hypothetical protein
VSSVKGYIYVGLGKRKIKEVVIFDFGDALEFTYKIK